MTSGATSGVMSGVTAGVASNGRANEDADASPNTARTEGVRIQRPDPGLGRGVWEAPPWFFYVTALVVVLGAAAYLAHRMGVFKRVKK